MIMYRLHIISVYIEHVDPNESEKGNIILG